MELPQLIALIVGSLAAASAGALWYYIRVISSLPEDNTNRLITPETEKKLSRQTYNELDSTDNDKELEKIKEITASRKITRERKYSFRAKLFQAGYYSRNDIRRFVIFQISVFLAALIITPVIVWLVTKSYSAASLSILFGALLGVVYPISKIDRRIERRKDKILFYLPLVIEQISIGVSSSLVVAACVSSVVEMAEERESRNPVTDLFEQVVKLVQAGYSFENAMRQVSDIMCMPVVEHTFNYLIQCSKHGGEISRQLQELANSTMTERNTKIHGKIAGLPAKATAPLGLVFAGFFVILIGGIFVRLFEVLPGG